MRLRFENYEDSTGLMVLSNSVVGKFFWRESLRMTNFAPEILADIFSGSNLCRICGQVPTEAYGLGYSAGQEVGKSCVVVTINGKRIMFDCGMHMGYKDKRQYPDFDLIPDSCDFTSSLSCIIITHFHLDHIGALPFFTQNRGYNGPIYMTYPTKALAPIMLEDYRKVMVDRRGEKERFSSEDIVEYHAVDLKTDCSVDKDLRSVHTMQGMCCFSIRLCMLFVTVWQHNVLGAAMFYAKVGDAAILYTGDYNMTPDRHLGAAQIDRLQLDLVITENAMVHKCVEDEGKVLIPTFALGRAQELCMLLDDYWERMNLKVPIYFSAGLTIQANLYYKVLINWTSQKVKDTYVTRNAFDFKNDGTVSTGQFCSFDRSLINAPGPYVLFATPGMIGGGFSLEVFRQWAPCEKNLGEEESALEEKWDASEHRRGIVWVLFMGWGKQERHRQMGPINFTAFSSFSLIFALVYCLAGTVGHKLMSAKRPTQIRLDEDVQIDVRCEIHQLSFSPHTDAKGIMDLVKFLSPKHVILVHGEKPKMAMLKERIESELAIQCYYPANNETVCISSTHHVEAGASDAFLQSCLCPNFKFSKPNSERDSDLDDSNKRTIVCDDRVAQGILTLEKNQNPKVVGQNEFMEVLGVENHGVKFAHCCPIYLPDSESRDASGRSPSALLRLIFEQLSRAFPGFDLHDCQEQIRIRSFVGSFCSKEKCLHRTDVSLHSRVTHLCCSWSLADEELAWKVLSIIKNLELANAS
ncbi:hypothetical protein DH2020_000837 [Rehmannia glutinosa]|uniref:Cleavage and polyadenylation specificity factor subunit 3-II n=1 Tax=Rehmannia glutinosa TaxID=99300 RepID=A0ABR0XY34_REHGL